MAEQRKTEWRRDGSGNFWRVQRGRMLFLFLWNDRWHWSVADSRHTRLSEESFASRGEAEAALSDALTGGPGEEPSAAEGRSGEQALR